MRVSVWRVLFGAALLIVLAGAWLERTPVFAQRSTVRESEALVPSGDLIALISAPDEVRQQLTLVDPKTRVISVYHIERSTGKITLKSVRNVRFDLMVEEFNGASPSPREIQALLQ